MRWLIPFRRNHRLPIRLPALSLRASSVLPTAVTALLSVGVISLLSAGCDGGTSTKSGTQFQGPPEQIAFEAGLAAVFAADKQNEVESKQNPLNGYESGTRAVVATAEAGLGPNLKPWLFEVVKIHPEVQGTKESGTPLTSSYSVRSYSGFKVDLAYQGHSVQMHPYSNIPQIDYDQLKAAIATMKPGDWLQFQGSFSVCCDGVWYLTLPVRITKLTP